MKKNIAVKTNSKYRFQYSILKFIEIIALLIPTGIIIFFLFRYILYFKMIESDLQADIHTSIEIWKKIRDFFYYFYFFLGGISVFVFETIKPVDEKLRKKFIIRMVLGFILLNFSYAITGLIIDLGWVFYFLFFKVTGQPFPTLHP